MNRRSEGGRSCIATPSISSSPSSDPVTCGAPTWIKKGLPCVCLYKKKGSHARICMNVTPLQEERLRRLKNRTKVYFDSTRLEHQEALRVLWSSTFPNEELDDLISDQWKKMGWQGKDPSTDFRFILYRDILKKYVTCGAPLCFLTLLIIWGAGFISLENLLFFAKTFSVSFQCLIQKQGSMGAVWEYPFAVAGVNITFMLIKMLDLDATKPRTLVSGVFIHMLSENEWAFDLLYCVTFIIMDKIWGEKNASYMEFNDVLKSTRAQLEEELLLDDVLRIEDMPSFRLLY